MAADLGSPPVALDIPAIHVHTALSRLGLNGDGTIQVPDSFGEAGWYRLGPAPGDPGPAVILGHVDSVAGPAIFYRLSALRPGDEIAVQREAGSVVHFRVQRVASYPVDAFPSAEVYGLRTGPELRLVTCTGWYSLAARRYSSNLVVFATIS